MNQLQQSQYSFVVKGGRQYFKCNSHVFVR